MSRFGCWFEPDDYPMPKRGISGAPTKFIVLLIGDIFSSHGMTACQHTAASNHGTTIFFKTTCFLDSTLDETPECSTSWTICRLLLYCRRVFWFWVFFFCDVIGSERVIWGVLWVSGRDPKRRSISERNTCLTRSMIPVTCSGERPGMTGISLLGSMVMMIEWPSERIDIDSCRDSGWHLVLVDGRVWCWGDEGLEWRSKAIDERLDNSDTWMVYGSPSSVTRG